jgi:hypothetical protein
MREVEVANGAVGKEEGKPKVLAAGLCKKKIIESRNSMFLPP